jgi:transposase-like protein
MVSEVISRVEQRRHWPTAKKLRILSEALAPGATIAAVAACHLVRRPAAEDPRQE